MTALFTIEKNYMEPQKLSNSQSNLKKEKLGVSQYQISS